MADHIEQLNIEVRAREKAAREAEAALQARLAYESAPGKDAATIRADAAEKEEWAIEEARSNAQRVLNEYGDKAPKPIMGEKSVDYRRRVLMGLAPNTRYSQPFIDSVPAKHLEAIEAVAFADAIKNAAHPADLAPGEMREVIKRDAAGRQIHEFVSGAGSRGLFQKVYGAFIDPVLRVSQRHTERRSHHAQVSGGRMAAH